MKFLKRQQILEAKDQQFKDVLTPEWADPADPPEVQAVTGVRVRNLTGQGRGAFIQMSMDMKEKADNKERVNFEIEMLLVAMTVVDENGAQQFTVEDVEALGQKNAAVIGRLATVAQQLSALDKASTENTAKK